MFKRSFKLRNVAKIGVACLAVTAIFSGCEEEEPQSGDRQIIAFSFDVPPADGKIDEEAKTISVSVPNGTVVTALVPEITVSDNATVSPRSGVAQNFTNPVIYTVKAEDGSTEEYTVTVKAGAGGDDDGLFKDAKFNLPENVSIKFESTAGGLTTKMTFVKIGNDFYGISDLSSMSLGVSYQYLKYNGTNWQTWEKRVATYGGHDWEIGETLTATEVVEAIGGLGQNMLNFMTFEASYVSINGKPKSGTEAVAGVMCDKYVITEYGSTCTYYHDPVTKLFFKVDWGDTLYVVTSWNATVTDFGDIDLP
jgi:hypothetical protein